MIIPRTPRPTRASELTWGCSRAQAQTPAAPESCFLATHYSLLATGVIFSFPTPERTPHVPATSGSSFLWYFQTYEFDAPSPVAYAADRRHRSQEARIHEHPHLRSQG